MVCMATRKSTWGWISLTVGGLVVGALGTIFIVLDLEQADQLASVVGVFVALAGLGISVYGVVLARRSSSPASSQATAPRSDIDAITEREERSVAVRDNFGVIQTGDAGRAAITGAGNASNTITGGTFHGPVTMARDIVGPSAAQLSPPPALPSDDPDVPEQLR